MEKNAMRNQQKPEARKSGDVALDRKLATKPAVEAADRRRRAVGQDRNSNSGAGASARQRRKPFVL
jgi:hypothetical protein